EPEIERPSLGIEMKRPGAETHPAREKTLQSRGSPGNDPAQSQRYEERSPHISPTVAPGIVDESPAQSSPARAAETVALRTIDADAGQIEKGDVEQNLPRSEHGRLRAESDHHAQRAEHDGKHHQGEHDEKTCE